MRKEVNRAGTVIKFKIIRDSGHDYDRSSFGKTSIGIRKISPNGATVEKDETKIC